MNNYEYIIAGLPGISTDWKFPDNVDFESIVAGIRELCSEKDNKLIDSLLDGFDEDTLGPEFYAAARKSGNKFIREYFLYDLQMRNAKVRYLNSRLGRPADQDVFDDVETDAEDLAALSKVLDTEDILTRERGLDDLVWEKISSMNTFDYFNIEAVLGFIAKLRIIDRWYKLDEGTGREMFRRLVNEVRGTFKGVEYQG